MDWPIAFAFAVGAIAFTAMISVLGVYQPADPESPKVTCIKEHGQWVDGYGRIGWSGTCTFPKAIQ